MYSVKKQLARHLLINLTIMVFLFVFLMGFAIKQVVTDYSRSHLQHDIDSLIKSLNKNVNNTWTLSENSIPVVYQRIGSGYYFQIVTPDKTLYSRSVFDADLAPPRPQQNATLVYRMKDQEQHDLLVMQQKIEKEGSQITIWVAENLSAIEDRVLFYILITLGVALLLLCFMFWTQQRILGNAFRVFDTLKTRMDTIAEEDVRLEDLPIPIEVSPLARQIQNLANRFRERLQRTRRSIGNLSHELKRPLQLLSIEVEKDPQSPLSAPVEEIHQIIERELRRAKVSGATGATAQIALLEELSALLSVLQRLHPDKQFKLDCAPTLRVSLDRDDLLELCGNLIDNAGKFASKSIKISIRTNDDKLQLSIEDDGPGVPPELVGDIVKAGTRLDESVHGHGLGLSICLDIINIYHGTIEFGIASMGGLKVDIMLPLGQELDG